MPEALSVALTRKIQRFNHYRRCKTILKLSLFSVIVDTAVYRTAFVMGLYHMHCALYAHANRVRGDKLTRASGTSWIQRRLPHAKPRRASVLFQGDHFHFRAILPSTNPLPGYVAKLINLPGLTRLHQSLSLLVLYSSRPRILDTSMLRDDRASGGANYCLCASRSIPLPAFEMEPQSYPLTLMRKGH